MFNFLKNKLSEINKIVDDGLKHARYNELNSQKNNLSNSDLSEWAELDSWYQEEFPIPVLSLTLANTDLTSFKYLKKKYMESKEWKHLKNSVLFINNSKCEMCADDENLDVHHKTYKHIGHENMDDLAVVCRSCHEEIHDEYGYDYNHYFPLIKY